MTDPVFDPTKTDGFEVSVSSLTLGTLYEAVLSFSSEDRFESFWPSVCRNSRWLIPSRRMCIVLRREPRDGASFEIAGQFERGEFTRPARADFTPTPDRLRRALAQKKAQWFARPGEQFSDQRSDLASWLFRDRPETLFVLPISAKEQVIGALLFAMSPIADADQTMLTALGTVLALHVGMTCTLIQITEERKEMEHRLIMQEKMASLGNLVAGVAHEVNNPIGAVNSAVNVTARCIEKLGELVAGGQSIEDVRGDSAFQKTFDLLRKNNEVIAGAGDRITRIVRSLRDFARLDEAEFQRADIHQGIDTTLTVVDHELKGRVEVVREYGDVPRINCYPNQLNQVFMNLFLNAAHAIEDTGVLGIRTWADAENVWVKVTDTGAGIPPEHLDRIFDPGFTTKGVGVGTGLGLSICYNIVVQDHKGSMEVTSQVGEGSQFTLALPIRQPESPSAGQGLPRRER